MDKKYRKFKQNIDRKLNVMDAKLSYMREGLDGFHEALNDFREEFHLFIDYTSENISDHEQRIIALEKKAS
ncbi:MAG: hypothetical protein AAF620_19495 [Bacteroidota bacterium]